MHNSISLWYTYVLFYRHWWDKPTKKYNYQERTDHVSLFCKQVYSIQSMYIAIVIFFPSHSKEHYSLVTKITSN